MGQASKMGGFWSEFWPARGYYVRFNIKAGEVRVFS
jgi:hypothetical protein